MISYPENRPARPLAADERRIRDRRIRLVGRVAAGMFLAFLLGLIVGEAAR